MRLRLLIPALLAVLLVAFPGSALAAPPPPRIAYVDVTRVLLEVEDAKAAKARLQKWLDDRQAEINAEQDALRKEKELLDKQASTMKEDVRARKGAELQTKVLLLTQKWDRFRAEAAEKERKEMEPIQAKIDQIVATIAVRGGYNWVVEKREAGVLYADAQFDLTSEVIRTYNATASVKK